MPKPNQRLGKHPMPMVRIPEPELMDTEEQARAYAKANFSEAHQSYVTLFQETFPQRPAKATVLDLGCGPADVTLRFAQANPGYSFHAVDGSAAMLTCAREALRSSRNWPRQNWINSVSGSSVTATSSFSGKCPGPDPESKWILLASRHSTLEPLCSLAMPFVNRPLTIAGHEFRSRLLVGTGKFSSPESMREALDASGAQIVTVALRRADLSGKKDPFANILEFIDPKRYLVLPNTSGALNAEEAVRLARLAAAAGLPKWVKLEIHPDPRYLLPDPVETLKAAEILV